MSLILTPAERTSLIDSARDALVDRLYNELANDIQIVSNARAAGMLDVGVNTLEGIGLPRVMLTNKLVKYNLRDIAAFIASRREK